MSRFMVVILVIGVLPGHVFAERLVIESHTSEPEDVDLLMATVRSVLEKRGHLTSSNAFLSHAADHMPRAHGAPSEQTIGEFHEHLGRGFRRWTDVAFVDAVDSFTRALAMTREYPLLVTQSAEVRQDLFLAHVMLFLAYRRAGESNAARRMVEEMIRRFPDQTISVKRFGPQPERLRQETQEALRAQGMARLAVTTPGVNDARVFVNERFVGVSPVSLELVPGEYQVFATTDTVVSSLRTITLEPKGQEVVELDALFDNAIELEPRLALGFADEAARDRFETAYALQLSRMADVKDGAIILSVRTIRGKSVLMGRVITASGATWREGYIAAHRDAPVSHLHALAAFLDGDAPSPDVHVSSMAGGVLMTGLARDARDNGDGDARFRFGKWKWAAFGVGAAGVAAGVTYLSMDGRGTCSGPDTCPRVYDTRTLGISSLALATVAVSAGAGAWLYDRKQAKKSQHRLTVAPHGRGVSIVLSGSF